MAITGSLTTLHAAQTQHKPLQAANSNQAAEPEALAAKIRAALEDGKAENIVVLDIAGRSALADYMIIAEGASARHLGALADRLAQLLKAETDADIKTEGMGSGDWVLIDEGDIIVHLFRPEVRAFYRLEKMWGADGSSAAETETERGLRAETGAE